MAKVKQFLPTKEDILKFIHAASHDLSKREIAKAFNIKGELRIPFKTLLKEIETEGSWKKRTRRDKKGEYKANKQLSGIAGKKRVVMPCEIIEVLSATTYLIAPTDSGDDGEPIHLTYGSRQLHAGTKVLAKVQRNTEGLLNGSVIKVLGSVADSTIGVFQERKNGGYIYPVSKKQKIEFYVAAAHTGRAKEGDIVRIEPFEGGKNHHQGKVLAVLGNIYEPKGLSLISILQHDLPHEFSEDAIAEAERGTIPLLKNREDLRDYNLVTIDGEDARDFDDAVYAEPKEDGWHIIVSIADVSYYVRPNSALDKEAYARGTSVYFPDRVVPMLPEKLSNDLCSLRPHQDRACIAVHIHLDKECQIQSFKFVRGLMQSKARLTYNEVQAIQDGKLQSPLSPAINHMYRAYEILLNNRMKRGALDIDLPEHQIILDKHSNLKDIKLRERLDSHKLIEEFMILANVCAAKALESKRAPCLYRIHDTPSDVRVDGLRGFLQNAKLLDSKSPLVTPHDFNEILNKVRRTPQHVMVSEMVLRAQQQAVYSPSNHGHFGLGLTHYAHFTSPIRRYADLIVHRNLIRAFDLGEGEAPENQLDALNDIALHINEQERSAEAAEREVINRYLCLYMLNSEELRFEARISSVTSFGMFVEIEEHGISGLIPIAPMSDFFVYYEESHELKGRSSGIVYHLGDRVRVKLEEVNVLTGQISFHLDEKKGSRSQSSRKH